MKKSRRSVLYGNEGHDLGSMNSIQSHASQNLNALAKYLISAKSSSYVDDVDSDNKNKETQLLGSNFDISEERLRYIFNRFDSDHNGQISYESFMKGLEMQYDTNDSISGDAFKDLVEFLDEDNSGTISFEEFSDGTRLLMLRALFSNDHEHGREGLKFEVLDYDMTKLEKANIGYKSHIDTKADGVKAKYGFFFNYRPEWVQTRWINIDRSSTDTVESAVSTMKKLAAKYKFHPLAIEDALSPSIRPKAETFASHYLIIFPVLSLEVERPPLTRPKSAREMLPKRFCCCSSLPFKVFSKNQNFTDRPQIAKVNVECVSIFVTVPNHNTIVTLNNNGTSDTRRDYWHRVKKELNKGYSKLRQYDAQHLTYVLLHEAAEQLVPIIATMRDEVSREREYLKHDKYKSLSRVYQVRRELEKIRKKMKPFTRLLMHVVEDDTIAPGATIYLRDVHDNLEGISDDVNELIDECLACADVADKFHSRRMDRTLYTLTVVSAVFLPAQFLTGVWGMNFEDMPELSQKFMYPFFFWILTGSLIVILLLSFNCGRLPNYNID